MRRCYSVTAFVACCALLSLLLPPPPAAAQPSSGLPADHSPRGALWRAAVAPGWGQIYNRQYVKLPFVYAGLGGLLAYGIYMQRRVVLYRRAFRYADWYDPQTERSRYEEDFDSFAKVLRQQGVPDPSGADPSRFERQLRRSRENTKRNRNLLFIASGFYYALSVLDAYVSAHLLDFDVSKDLTMRAHPHPTGGFSVNVTLAIGG